MNQSFTAEAEVLWQKVPEWAKEKVLTNVWCGQCRGVITMINFSGKVVGDDLLLTGICKVCSCKVARLLESA
jgi:hypothetical protein